MKDINILRRRDVEEKTGLKRAQLYALIKDGKFPTPINLGSRSVGWVESEVNAWLMTQIKKSRQK